MIRVVYGRTTGDGRRYIVRGYRLEDRRRVRHICCETGLLGRPQEAWFEGRAEFADMFSSYYTDHEPECALVSVVNHRVEAYLLGCLDSKIQKRVFNRKILPGITMRMFNPKWWLRPVNRSFLRAMRLSRKRKELKIPEQEIFDKYPAHLHINIADPGLRGQGIGQAMMQAYFEILRTAAVPGVHLGTTSHNRTAVRFYKNMGFEVLVERRLTCYDHVIDDPPVYLLYFGKRL
ncbi:MAG: GNAT family N-acetyltransferase [Deltaproteobacteria bacterium]|nr:GNAT family N-acetyltransferase [Deltaproteobacteria bacterium]